MEPVLRRIDARDYLRILTKRKWFVIMVALAATIIGGLYTVSYPKTYRASSTVLIRRQGEPIIWVGDRGSQGPQREDLALETQARIAASIDCAEIASKALAARTSGDAIQAPAQEIAGSITATPRDPDLLVIEAVHRESAFAVAFANEVAEAFVKTSLELRRTESKAAKDFLREAHRRSKEGLDQAQMAAAQYQEQTGIVLPNDEPKLAIEQLTNYQGELKQAQAELASTIAQTENLRAQLRRTPGYRVTKHQQPNPQRQALVQQLQSNQMALTELRARYTDNWPAVREMTEKIQEIKSELEREPEMINSTTVDPEPEYATLRHELSASERKIADVRARIAALRATVGSLEAQKQYLPQKLAHLQRLLDRVELAKISYQNVQAQLENASLNEAMKQADAELIDHAAGSSEISPKLGRMLIFSLTLGLACGVALAMFLEALDDTLHTPDDIATYTEATFLGMVPLLEDPAQGLVTVMSPKSPPAEAYRTLRSNIHFAQVDQPVHTFLVTSAGAGEGKTMTTANLAAVFAQSGQDVLLIDTDLRRPSLHRIFNLPSERGLTNVLVGETSLDEVILDTDVPGLRLVPTGPLPPNPAELLESQQMTRVIERAQELADVVFFDSPPAIVLTDAVVMSSKVERTILVAEAGAVTRDAFNEMYRLITNARGTVMGAVLNKLRLSAADYYYYYYYYDYSHYSPRRTGAEPARGAGTPQAGFTSVDAPTMLEEIFGPENALPPLPQVQQPPQPQQQPPLPPLTPQQPPYGAQQPPLAPPPPPQDEQPPTRSPLQDLFGPQDENGQQ
ncbi:MAG: polysaccharide biosynthesis tyrosine autokinase [Armatimonadia bacterium]